MDLNFTPEEIAFREEVRAVFRTELPAEIRRKCILGQRLEREGIVRWTHILHAKGWAAPNWPAEWGGPGWNTVQQYIFRDELYLAPARSC